LLALTLAACGDEENAPGAPAAAGAEPVTMAAPASGMARWYTQDQVARGKVLFAKNCAVCHGKGAQGTFAWRRRGPDGTFPPPPLDGNAHAWHHPFRDLAAQVKFGTPAGQGSMPGFRNRLNDEQVGDVIAWFQSYWSDEIYRAWGERDRKARGVRR